MQSRVAQWKEGYFYWVLVRSSAKDPEWQPARFVGVAGHGAGATWQFIGFNGGIGRHFVEVVDVGPELTDGPQKSEPAPAAPPMDFRSNRSPAGGGRAPHHQRERKTEHPRRLK